MSTQIIVILLILLLNLITEEFLAARPTFQYRTFSRRFTFYQEIKNKAAILLPYF